MNLKNKISKVKKSKNNVLINAINLHQKGDIINAKAAYQKFYDSYPDYLGLRATIAKICIELGQYDEALYHTSEDLKYNPKDPNVLSNCAFVQVQLGLLSEAEKNISQAIELNPNRLESHFILCSVLTAQGKNQEALKVAIHALSINPTSASALNNLGTALQKTGDTVSARVAFESACILSPDSHEPYYNLASLEAIQHNSEKAIFLYNKSLEKKSYSSADITSRVLFSLSFEYLKIGKLIDGWKNYDFGFNNAVPFEYRRAPNRTFQVPRWTGGSLNGQRLLIWAEQGIGDELLFLTCLADLDSIDGYILVECDSRLVSPLGRSFPKIIFRPSSYHPTLGLPAVFNDYDLHIPMGGLMEIFRNDISDFERSKPYIIVDSKIAQDFEDRLNTICGSRKRIGICWRSGQLSAQRNINYTSLSDWGSILSLPNAEFINLQYGECEQELLEAEEKYDIRILRWPDLDLKNDIDSVLSLMSRLDIVVTIDSAVSPMAASVGLRVLLMGQKGWNSLGTEYFPWFANVQCFFPPDNGIVADCLYEVGALLTLETKTD
jgi:Flp pilus assembly protein TadD